MHHMVLQMTFWKAEQDILIGGPEIQNADSVHVIVNELIGKELYEPLTLSALWL